MGISLMLEQRITRLALMLLLALAAPAAARAQADGTTDSSVESTDTGGLAADAAWADSPAASQVASEVALQSYNGNYLASEGGGGADVNANRTWVREWETFSVVDINGGALYSGEAVNLRTWDGHYLCAEGGGGGDLNATRTVPREWETFTVQKVNGGGPIGFGDQVTFRTYNGHYVVADYTYQYNRVRADRTVAREWETFTLGHGRPTGFGLVPGNKGMYQDPYQPFHANPDRFTCEFNQLGARWIRYELGWNNDPEWVTAKLVARAHAAGIKVIVLVPADGGHYPYYDCDAPYDPSPSGQCAQRDRWLEAYINKLRRLTTNVLKIDSPYGDARADAFEILNEPNVGASTPSGFHVPGATFAWTVRKAWEWKLLERRPELIISGGTLNTYTSETAWWDPFLNSQAFTRYVNQQQPPYDYMAVHPYHPSKIDQVCLNNFGSNCFDPWINDTRNLLIQLSGRMNQVTNKAAGTRFFVTEYGWSLPTTAQGPPLYGRCRIPDRDHPPRNCVNTTAQMVSGMQAGADAFAQSNVVVATLWYQYRDDPPNTDPQHLEDYGRLGLRYYWNGSNYPVKEDVWQRFRALAGGTGSSAACGL
jgi:hypothetical protein